jgi:hypothetical protein
MAHIVIIGAGIGGMPMAYEMAELARKGDRITVVSNTPNFHFVPSNPWVAVNWRTCEDIEFTVGPYLATKGIEFVASGVKRVHPEQNHLELNDGTSLGYDFLIIATGPKLAFEEVEGLGPNGHTGTHRRTQDRLHDRNHGHRHRPQHSRRTGRQHAVGESDVECHLPCGFRRHRRGLRRPAADSAAQRQLVQGRRLGAPGQGGLREIIRKMKKGSTDPLYEKYVLSALGIKKLKEPVQ